MSRIAWNRHPDDVEPVVAILLASRYAGAKRIRPSRGDRGIDVLAPSTEPGMVDVYQVKRFAENLNASQKSQIEHSLEVIGETAAARGVRVANWYLTLPLDPTPENLDWLAAISSNYEFQCDWRGLSFIDSLAAEFPAVIDYYLRDGRDRLEHAMADLARIIHGRVNGDQNAQLQSQDLRQDLAAIYRAINEHDPHYRYSFRVDEHPPELRNEPGMTFGQQTIAPDLCISHMAFERYAGATEDRPIEISMSFSEEDLSAERREQLRQFFLYGTEVSAPATVHADLPGGLGTQIETLGGAWLGQSETAQGESYRLSARST